MLTSGTPWAGIWSLVLLLGFAGCWRAAESEAALSSGPTSDVDSDTDSDVDSDTDSDADSDTDSDTDSDVDSDSLVECIGEPWDELWTYGEDYSEGPYGFKGSMCWDLDFGFGDWSVWGDTIPAICLPDHNDVEVCLSEYIYSTEHELIFVHYTAMWCPPCNDAAQGEQEFIDHLADQGWSAKWISIIGEAWGLDENPTADDAAEWITLHELGEDAVVLYDPEQEWASGVFMDKWPGDADRGWPMTFVVHTSNMLLWEAHTDWADPDVPSTWQAFLDWWTDESSGLLQYCAEQPGAVDE